MKIKEIRGDGQRKFQDVADGLVFVMSDGLVCVRSIWRGEPRATNLKTGAIYIVASDALVTVYPNAELDLKQP